MSADKDVFYDILIKDLHKYRKREEVVTILKNLVVYVIIILLVLSSVLDGPIFDYFDMIALIFYVTYKIIGPSKYVFDIRQRINKIALVLKSLKRKDISEQERSQTIDQIISGNLLLTTEKDGTLKLLDLPDVSDINDLKNAFEVPSNV